MNSREKKIIGVSVPAALLCVGLAATLASKPLERMIVAQQTREKAEEAVKHALTRYPSAKAAPCEMGPVIGEFPVKGAVHTAYQCGEVPVFCNKKNLDTSWGDYVCHVPRRFRIHITPEKVVDNWQDYKRRFEDWKRTGYWDL